MAVRTSRAVAARILAQVFTHGRSLDEALTAIPTTMDPRDRAMVRALCYGVMRWYPRLNALSAQLLHKPLRDKDADIHALLLMGIFQLDGMDIAPHAAVGETVSAAKELNKPWARGVLNASLRRFQRESGSLIAAVDKRDAGRLAHPGWVLKRLRGDWPEEWQSIAEANNERAPMALRVSRLHTDLEAYQQALSELDFETAIHPHARDALVLERPMDVHQLPGFKDGHASVQDTAAQLAAELMDPQPGDRVLDACAAPGGKTAHLLEKAGGDLDITALDVNPQRLETVEENLERLGLSAGVVAGDAAEPEGWWDGEAYDRILIDAPCSASGVIRRHPDIKYLRRDEDIVNLAEQQGKILEALWPMLRPGGRLVYATCSVFKAENEQITQAFQDAHPDAQSAMPESASWGRVSGPGRQILPGEDGMDGFFYASWIKTTCESV